MYSLPASSRPSALRNTYTVCERFDSSTKLSGHSRLINSSFASISPRRSTNRNSASKAFGWRGTGSPPRSSRRLAGSRVKGPNS